jgi:hypothetical protein
MNIAPKSEAIVKATGLTDPLFFPVSVAHSNELWLIGGFGFGAFNDVWRSADGANWRLDFSDDIVSP